ncbi:MAG: MalY/PatB family protein [Myxococcota bacterium]|nr:MalY/PatB family protein [Myxococcota bacterium]
MSSIEAAGLHFVVEPAPPGAEGGPTLAVRSASGGGDWLRFECRARGARLWIGPSDEGAKEVLPAPEFAEPIAWAVGCLRDELPALLAKAGFDGDIPGADACADVLGSVETALRNPPARLSDFGEPELRARTGEKWQVYPDDVLPFWVADMDFPVAEPIRRQMERAAAVGDLGYPLHPRPHALPRVFARRMADRYGYAVDVKRVCLLADVMQGVHIGIATLSEPGDGVIVQPPIYPPFFAAATEHGRRLVENPLVPGPEGYELDFDGLRAAARDSRVLLLSNPHNPTGRVFTRIELEKIAEIALENDLFVISDEIHSDLIYAPGVHVPIATLSPEIEARTLTLNAASKAFNIAGLRTAAAAFGSAEIKQRFESIPSHVRGGLNTLGIQASLVAWTEAEPWLEEVRAALHTNRDFAVDFVRREMPGIRTYPPEATYLLWLDCRDLGLEPNPWRFFLREAKVGLSDGPAFGTQGEGFVRFNFATSRALVEQGLTRMAEALRRRS